MWCDGILHVEERVSKKLKKMEVLFHGLLVDGFISGSFRAQADCSFLGRSILRVVVATANVIVQR